MKDKFILLFFFITGLVFSQEKTLINSNISSSGWFGSPVMKYSSVNKKSSLFLGARGGYIINHSLVVGGGMYGLVSDITSSSTSGIANEDANNLHLMYGGFELGYIVNSMELIHYSFNTLFGIGRVSNNLTEYNGNESDHHEGQSFFVIEPKGAVEINITHYLRFEIGVSYRIASGLEYEYLSNNDLSGPNGFLSINIGTF
jgi:hypothetical protein